ncbi:MAG: hypothetical protein K6E73_11420 [Bacteroidales bacterium]|nr:hypothetical protein [Bacteroidales bacterium]
MKAKDKIKSYIGFVKGIAIVILTTFIYIYVVDYPERTRLREYRKILSEEHKITKGYVYIRNSKSQRLLYRFTIDGIQYCGESKYYRTRPFPKQGDSIWVYYQGNDPNVNLWAGMFDE